MTRKTSPTRQSTATPTPTPVTGELVKVVHVGRLETVTDWRRQIGKIYREMRKGELAPEDGTKLAFVANLGAQLAKVVEELELHRKWVAAMDAHNARVAAGAPADHGTVDLFPALDVVQGNGNGGVTS